MRSRCAVNFSILLVALLPGAGLAEDRSAELSVTGRLGAVSNYVSRGLTQTWGLPAVQGDVELEHDSGFYVGSFVSNISNKIYPGGTYEIEVWSGYEHELSNDAALSVEGIYYAYPGANFSKGNCGGTLGCANQSFNTFQPRLGARWRWLSTRIAYALTDYFGDSVRTGFRGSTRGTWYWEANADYAVSGAPTWHVIAHLGYTRYPTQFAFPNPQVSESPNYWDWRLGVTKSLGESFKGGRVGVYYTQASNRSFHEATSLTTSTKRDLGRPTVILGLDWTF